MPQLMPCNKLCHDQEYTLSWILKWILLLFFCQLNYHILTCVSFWDSKYRFWLLFFYYPAYIGSDITSLYNDGLCTLLLIPIADMIFSAGTIFSLADYLVTSFFSSRSADVKESSSESKSIDIEDVSTTTGIVTVATIILSCFWDLGLPIDTFHLSCLANNSRLISTMYLGSSFAPCSHLST